MLLSLTSAGFDAMVLGQQLEVTLDAAAAVTARCTDAARPEEIHSADSAEASTHTLRFFGLLASSDYSCVVSAGAVELGTLDFSTADLPEGIPSLSVTGSPGWGAYTLLNHFVGATDPAQKLLIVDPEGRIRWYWYLDKDVREGVEAVLLGSDAILTSGGMGLQPTIVSLTGEITYRGPDPSSGGRFHHDVGVLPSGEVIGLAENSNSADGASWTGFLIETRTPEDGALTQEWSSQTAVDAGQLSAPLGVVVDPYHANALTHIEDDEGESFLLSLRGTDQLVRMDAETGLLQWKLGSGGDFALLDESGGPGGRWFSAQHGPHWDLPLVTIYDNQGLGGQSRALQLQLDMEAMTAQIVWQWTEAGWYEMVWGDTDVLEGGTVLIARGHCSFCPTADISLPTDVIEVDPSTDGVIWQLGFPTRDDGLYRAERLDGCALFANAAYCQ